MKTIISISTVMAFILSFGVAFAADNSKHDTDKGSQIFDSMFGTGQEVSFDSISMQAAAGKGILGSATGGVLGDTDKGSPLFDSIFGFRQDVAFDSIPAQYATAADTQGKSAGGLRGDADKGSKIFDSMFGARQIVSFE